MVRPAFEPMTSCSKSGRSSNWAIRVIKLWVMILWENHGQALMVAIGKQCGQIDDLGNPKANSDHHLGKPWTNRMKIFLKKHWQSDDKRPFENCRQIDVAWQYHVPAFIFLAQRLFMPASARVLLVPFYYTFGMVRPAFEPMTSCSKSGRSSNWAIRVIKLWVMILWENHGQALMVAIGKQCGQIDDLGNPRANSDHHLGKPWTNRMKIFLKKHWQSDDKRPFENCRQIDHLLGKPWINWSSWKAMDKLMTSMKTIDKLMISLENHRQTEDLLG